MSSADVKKEVKKETREKPKGRKEILVKAVNLDGVIFQDRCQDIINRLGWEIRGFEYPICLLLNFTNNLFETRTDMIAERGENPISRVIIECKRAHPNFKTWVFYKRPRPEKQVGAVFFRVPSVIQSKYPEIEPGIRGWIFPELEPFEYCFDGREIRLDFETGKGNNLNKQSWGNDRIQEASRQVITGVFGLLEEEEKSVRANPRVVSDIVFLPVIITTAKLMIAEYDEKNIDHVKGEIKKEDIEFTEVNWLVYECPIPDGLNKLFYRYHVGFPRLEDKNLRKKMPIFVVNSEFMKEFFSKLSIGT